MTQVLRRPTRHELRELARLVRLWRNATDGNDWDRPGIENALVKADQDRRAPFDTLTRAALRAAADPANRTPAVIALEGDHWRAAAGAPRPAPVARQDRCSVCGDPLAGHWRTDHNPVRNVRPATSPLDPDAVADLRRQLTAAPTPASTEKAAT